MSKRIRARIATALALSLGFLNTLQLSANSEKQSGAGTSHPSFLGSVKQLGDGQQTSMEAVRLRAAARKDSTDPRVASQARRVLIWYEILTARNAEERHRSVRKLPVTIVRSSSDEGRVVDFVVGGERRIRWYPDARPIRSTSDEPTSGPSAIEECYDGEPPCVTEQEMEDLLYATADAEYWAGNEDAYMNDEYNAYVAFCDQNPWACEGLGGPSVEASCWWKATQGVVATAGAVANAAVIRGGVTAAAASGLKLTVLGSVAVYTAIGAGVFFAGVYVYEAVSCFYMVQEPEVKAMPFEPVAPPCLD
jgi:hypothetical protein